jgi:hypothetical protein
LIRGFLNRACFTAERILAATPAPHQIQHAALKLFRELSELDCRILEPAIRLDLAAASRRLAELQWIDSTQAVAEDAEPVDDLLASAREWRSGLPTGGVLDAGTFAARCGTFVGLFDELGSEEERTFAQAQAERLLRHVEGKRQLALSASAPEVSHKCLLVERWDVAILFARMARRHLDLRFLNTALKMNDWSISEFARRPRAFGPKQRAHFLLSLAEQEYAAKALL